MDNETLNNNVDETVAEAAETAAPAAEAAAEAAAENAAPARNVQRPAPMNRGKRKKVCMFCADKIDHIDYKDIARLRKCISVESSKILPPQSYRYLCKASASGNRCRKARKNSCSSRLRQRLTVYNLKLKLPVTGFRLRVVFILLAG